jgi:hypothetical protein
MILKIFSPKNLAKKLAFFRRKLAKIAENCDHNIDPWSFTCSLRFGRRGSRRFDLLRRDQTSRRRNVVARSVVWRNVGEEDEEDDDGQPPLKVKDLEPILQLLNLQL